MRKIESDNLNYIRNVQTLEEEINKQNTLVANTLGGQKEKLSKLNSDNNEIETRKEELEQQIRKMRQKNYAILSTGIEEKNEEDIQSMFDKIREAALVLLILSKIKQAFCDKDELDQHGGTDLESQYSCTLNQLKSIQTCFQQISDDYEVFRKQHKRHYDDNIKVFANILKREANTKQMKEKEEEFEKLRAKQTSKGNQKTNKRMGRKIMGKQFIEHKQKGNQEEIVNEEELEDEKYFM